MLSVEKSPLEIDKWQRTKNYVPEFPLQQLAGFSPRPIERRLDWVFYKTEMKIWAVWAVRAVRKKKWI